MSKKNSCVFASAVYIELAQLRGPHRQMGPTPQLGPCFSINSLKQRTF